MLLNQALQDKELDLRLRDRLIAEGKLSQADVDKYLSAIPDDAGNFIKVDNEPKQAIDTTEE